VAIIGRLAGALKEDVLIASLLVSAVLLALLCWLPRWVLQLVLVASFLFWAFMAWDSSDNKGLAVLIAIADIGYLAWMIKNWKRKAHDWAQPFLARSPKSRSVPP
jgi:hypothetical protein